jgi:hypothetical protein
MKYLDFFSTPSSFTIDQNRNFKTTIGGFLTLLSAIICVICSMSIGQDFLYKRNPKIYSETVYEKLDKPYELKVHELIVAWRLEDKHGNILTKGENYKLPFYPKAKFHKYENRSNTFERETYLKLNYTKCSQYFEEKGIDQTLHNKDNWNCIDLSNITMGGFWNTQFFHYFDFTLESCEEVEEDKFENCGNYTEILEYFKEDVYISFMYGKVFIQKNPDQPLLVELNNFYRKLDLKLSTNDICNFSYEKINDDKGIIFPYIHQDKKMTFRYCNPNYSLIDLYNYERGRNNKIYWAEYYLDSSYIQNYRTFSKISNFLASLGGFFNITFYIITIIYRPINIFKRNRYLLNYFFKYAEKEEPEELKKTFTAFKQINKNYTNNINKRKSIDYNKNRNYQEQNSKG